MHSGELFEEPRRCMTFTMTVLSILDQDRDRITLKWMPSVVCSEESVPRAAEREIATVEGTDDRSGNETEERTNEFVPGGRAVAHVDMDQETDHQPDDRADHATQHDSANGLRCLLVCHRSIVANSDSGCHTRIG